MLAMLAGFAPESITARDNGTVFTLHNADGETVGEVCVGTKKTRANFKAVPSKLTVSGRAKNWPGQGLTVTDSNRDAVVAAFVAAGVPVAAKQAAK